jgi:hypothetical protein
VIRIPAIASVAAASAGAYQAADMRGEARTVFFGRVSSHRESRLDLAQQHTKLRRYRLMILRCCAVGMPRAPVCLPLTQYNSTL